MARFFIWNPTMAEVRCIFEARDILGEGPVWDAARNRLWWVDIKRQLLHWHDVARGTFGELALDEQITSVAPRCNGIGLLAASRKGVGILDPETGRFDIKVAVEPDRPQNRSNDGNVGIDGRYWFGTMDDSETGTTGAVYSLDPDWQWRRVLDGFGITNTLVTPPDGESLYVVDSTKQTMWSHTIAPDGTLKPGIPFINTQGLSGAPDGSAVDAEGCVWNAQWGLSRVVRYRPNGTIASIVSLPVFHVSSCAFGGPTLQTLYITTARHLLSGEALENEPWAGGLFAIDTEVAGLKLPAFSG
jgi:sugar lactone lactonase YvrE